MAVDETGAGTEPREAVPTAPNEPGAPGEPSESGELSDSETAELAGPLGARMGQGLERLLATGDPQVATAEEERMRHEAETDPETPLEVPDSGVAAKLSDLESGAALAAPGEPARPFSGDPARALAASWMPPGIQGIDVSSHQSNVDWQGVWNQGARFAYVKATEGTYYKNPFYSQQYNGSKNTGMVRGAYHFAIPSRGSAATEANYFVNNGGGWSADGSTLPPLLDIEYNPYPQLGNTCYDMTAGQMVSWIREFSNTIKARTGRTPMIYTTTDWWRTCTGNSSAFADHPLHLANYSRTPGAIPAGWTTYNVWQYSSTGPFVGDSNVWNGTAASLYDFAVRQPSAPSITSAADVLAIDPAGTLLNYRARGTGQLNPPLAIGTGWSGTVSIHATDWNGDGVFDLLAQNASGDLNLYYGQGSGGFSGPRTVGTGWAQLRITVGTWDTASKLPGVIASDTRGRGWYYANTTGAVMASAPVALGTGFEGTLATLMDFNGDGVQEIILRRSNGDLVSRPRSANGTAGNAKTIGVGWQDAAALRTVTGFAGAGTLGILAEFAGGDLRYYGASKTGYWVSSPKVGQGWGPYLLANTQSLNTPPGPSIPSTSDIVTVSGAGDLLLYRAMLGGALRGPTRIGSGFYGVESFHTVDWNRDGVVDVVVQWAKGTVSVYHGLRQGGFAPARTIGSAGWDSLTVYPDPVVSQSGLPGILARDRAGNLRRYTNPDGASLMQGGTIIGQGWNGLRILSLDWNGDATADILALRPNGDMAYYRRDASGGFASSAPAVIGTGWDAFPTVAAGSDVMGYGGASVLAVDRRGNLYNYQVTGTGWWADKTILGTGWSGLLLGGS
ncbi:lysozyme [Arthrobacter sp. Sa2BUA2]|uniref:Lysozyme n=1 Tax=Arthrobacter pullicola TaxID=2762224 RepID=A0ABR8YJ12_9MICC|nr:lysozyme [Arthrobacter pullicola]MBD8044218.1 lysozyme [Arthrobacter pullicola]